MTATELIDPFEGPYLMKPKDFPENFINMKHPDDYILVPKPIDPEYILHKRDGMRLFLRISWKTSKGFLPMTFLLVTGNPRPISFCEEGMEAMTNNGLRHTHHVEGREEACVHIHHHERSEEDFFPAVMHLSQEKSVNIIGLSVLMKLGLHLNSEGYRFENKVPWF